MSLAITATERLSLVYPNYRWRRGAVDDALVAINEVPVRRARLVLGWINHLGV